MHPLITALRAHHFDLPAAAASLSDHDLLAAAADQPLLSSLESLLNLSRLCLTLQAAHARHALLTDLASTTPDTPAEQRRLANTLTRAADTRSLGGPALRPGSAAPPASTPNPPAPLPTHASMPRAPMPSSPSMPFPSIPPRHGPSPAARLLAAAAAPHDIHAHPGTTALPAP